MRAEVGSGKVGSAKALSLIMTDEHTLSPISSHCASFGRKNAAPTFVGAAFLDVERELREPNFRVAEFSPQLCSEESRVERDVRPGSVEPRDGTLLFGFLCQSGKVFLRESGNFRLTLEDNTFNLRTNVVLAKGDGG